MPGTFYEQYKKNKAAKEAEASSAQTLKAGPPIGTIDRLKELVRQRTGYFEPPLYGMPQERAATPFQSMGKVAAHQGAEVVSGLGLYLPDILANRMTGEEGLAEVVDKMTGFRPTPKDIKAGESAQYISGLITTGGVSRALVGKVVRNHALKTMLGAGIQFGTREAAEQLSDKIVKDEPFDLEGIHFEAGVGTLFGAGEVGLQRLVRFARGLKSTKALATYTPPKGAKISPQEHAAWARKQARAEIRAAQKAGGKEWIRVREKYMGFGDQAAKSAAKPPRPPRATAVKPGPIAQKAESVYQHYVNRFQSIENLTNRAKALGISIPPGTDPKLLSRTYLGVAGSARVALERRTFRVTPEGQIEDTGEGLKPILDDYDHAIKPIEPKAKVREQDMNDYANAQRTIYDLQRKADPWSEGNIVSDEQVAIAHADLKRLQDKYGDRIQVMDDIAQRKTEYRRRILHLLVDSGNMSQAEYDRLLSLHPHYTPFNRVLEKFEQAGAEGEQAGTGGKPFTKARTPVHRIKGSELDVANTTESDIKNTYRVMDVAQRNKVARGVADMMDIFPEEIAPVKRKVYPIRVSPSEIKTELKEFRRKTKSVLNETSTEQATGTASGPLQKMEQVVREALMHRGMTEGEANNYLRKLKSGGAGGSERTVIEKIVKETEQVLRTNEPLETTIFRPKENPAGRVIEYWDEGQRKFMEVSPNLYDAMTGLTEEGLGILTKLLSIPAHTLRVGATITPEFMARNPIRDQYTALFNTNFGFVPFVDTVKALADMTGHSPMYEEWLQAGGAYAGFVELSRPSLKKMTSELQRSPVQKAMRRLNLLNTAEDVSMFFERGTRVGIYERARKSGLSALEASYKAREGTTDFNRYGSKMKAVKNIVAFLNAGLQGTDRAVRSAKADPIGFAVKGMALITVPSIALYLRNRRDPEYYELPRWRRDIFWNTRIGDHWVSWPKPFGYGQLFGTLPERFMEFADTNNPKAFDDLAKTLVESSTPLSGDPASGILPTGIKPIIETATDWDFFRQRTVVPPGRKDLIDSEQYGRYTSETAKVLGKWFNYSPSKIDHLVNGFFGGTGRYALDATDVLISQVRQSKGQETPFKMPMEPADIPLVKGFVARDPKRGTAQSFQDFYAKGSELERYYNTWREYIKTRRFDEAAAFYREHPDLIVGRKVPALKAGVSRCSKAIDEVMRDPELSDKQKQIRVRQLERARFDLVQSLNRMLQDPRLQKR